MITTIFGSGKYQVLLLLACLIVLCPLAAFTLNKPVLASPSLSYPRYFQSYVISSPCNKRPEADLENGEWWRVCDQCKIELY